MRARGSVAILVAALTLTACAAGPAPLDSIELAPSSSPTPTSTAEITPIPEATPDPRAGWPRPRVSLECDDFEDLVVDALGVMRNTVTLDVVPLANGSAASLQAGMFTCNWISSTQLSADMGNAYLRLEVLPDAAADFAAYEPGTAASTKFGLLGPGSRINCFVEPGSANCHAAFLAGSYWVEFSIFGLAPSGATDSTVLTDGVTFGKALGSLLQASGAPGPEFVLPESALGAWTSCDQIDAGGAFRAVAGAPSFTAPDAGFDGGGAMFFTSWQRAGLKDCAWRHDDVYSTPEGQSRQVSITMLPGGGWAWDDLKASALDRGASAVTVAGATEAVILCRETTECNLDALVRGSYLNVNMSYPQFSAGDGRGTAIRAMEFAIARL